MPQTTHLAHKDAIAPNSSGPPEGMRTAIRRQRIDLGGDYEGWWATMRVNPPLSVWEDFSSGQTERFDRALATLVDAWNFVDDLGQPIPLPATEGFAWSDYPFDLKIRLTSAYSVVVQDRLSPPKAPSTTSELTSPNGT